MKLLHPWSVRVTAEGVNLSRFVRRAGEAGIRLRRLKKISGRSVTAMVREDDLPLLQDIIRSGGWRLTMGQRTGFGRTAHWVGRRGFFAAAMCMGVISLAICSQLVWRVEVVGGGAYRADILGAVEEMGIHPPLLRRQVELGKLRDALEWRYPRLAWVECGWRGTTLVIRPIAGELPEETETKGLAMDVVADRDGVVSSVVTVAGTPSVKPGDIVRAGDILIRGEEKTSEGAVRSVAARGSVKARVWVSASVLVPAWERITRYSGRQERTRTLRTPWFDLWGLDECSYEQYDTAVSEMTLCGIFIPVKMRTETRMEADITLQPRQREEMEREGYAAAVHKLKEKIGAEESMIDIWGNCSMINTENLLSVAVGELLVEIGRRVPVSGMAAPAGDKPEQLR